MHSGRGLPGGHAGESEVDDLPHERLHLRHPSLHPSRSVTGREKKLNAASYGFTGRMGDAIVRSTRPSDRCLLGGRVLRAVGTVGIALDSACGARSALASRTAWDA